jgi:hypothetical protein
VEIHKPARFAAHAFIINCGNIAPAAFRAKPEIGVSDHGRPFLSGRNFYLAFCVKILGGTVFWIYAGNTIAISSDTMRYAGAGLCFSNAGGG